MDRSQNLCRALFEKKEFLDKDYFIQCGYVYDAVLDRVLFSVTLSTSCTFRFRVIPLLTFRIRDRVRIGDSVGVRVRC